MKTIFVIGAVLGTLILIGWLGTQIQPDSFPALQGESSLEESFSLPEDLPEPVQRYYQAVSKTELPLIDSAVVSGRGTMRINGITLPVRWRFSYRVGEDYRHYIETTWFGIPVLRVNESYLNGTARLELPFGISEGDQVDQGANLGLWAEMIWMPSVWLSDPDVSWTAVNSETALLTVPFGSEKQTFIVRFDPKTGLISQMESMRYKGEESERKVLWINQVEEYQELEGAYLPAKADLTWLDEGTPWAKLSVEEVVYNLDLEDGLQIKEEQ